MKIISLASSIAGPACAIAVSIKKYFYNNNYQTNIFDYLEINLKSINYILETIYKNNNIEDLLRTNNEIYLNNDGRSSVIFKNFDKFISHHDLPHEYNDEQYLELINKYIRRYDRLKIDLYKEDKIFFLRFGKENKEDIINFIKNVNMINPLLKVYFIHLDYNDIYGYTDINRNDNDNVGFSLFSEEHLCSNENTLDYQIEKKEDILKINYNYINFYEYIDVNKIYNENLFYKTIQFNWYIVYQYIESISNELTINKEVFK
jgi:hypothetical protein